MAKYKNCTKCGKHKDLNAYHKNIGAHDGVKSICKDCSNATLKAKGRTKHGLASRIYKNQCKTSRMRTSKEGIEYKVKYTRDELYEWLMSQETFHHQFNIWKNSGYDKMVVPSIDRLDDYGNYTFGNIRVVSWEVNRKSYHTDAREGKNNKNSQPVVQLSKDGEFIAEFRNIKAANKAFGTSKVGDVCRGNRKIAGGYVWKYKAKKVRNNNNIKDKI